jgi:hypothetical protein
MKPVEKSQYINVYLLLYLETTGKVSIQGTSVTEQGDMGHGMYSKLETAQYQQTILALKGIKSEIFYIEYPL